MMESPELSINVGELLDVPRVSLHGCMDSWHQQAVASVLTGLRDHGTTSVVLDLGGLSFAGYNGATSMINTLRSLGPQICVHVVASGNPASLLGRAELGPCIKLYTSTDEIAEYLAPCEDYFTSRWIAEGIEDYELPLAA